MVSTPLLVVTSGSDPGSSNSTSWGGFAVVDDDNRCRADDIYIDLRVVGEVDRERGVVVVLIASHKAAVLTGGLCVIHMTNQQLATKVYKSFVR